MSKRRSESAEGGVKISSLGGVTSTRGTSVTGGHVNVTELNMLCACIYFHFSFSRVSFAVRCLYKGGPYTGGDPLSSGGH